MRIHAHNVPRARNCDKQGPQRNSRQPRLNSHRTTRQNRYLRKYYLGFEHIQKYLIKKIYLFQEYFLFLAKENGLVFPNLVDNLFYILHKFFQDDEFLILTQKFFPEDLLDLLFLFDAY